MGIDTIIELAVVISTSSLLQDSQIRMKNVIDANCFC